MLVTLTGNETLQVNGQDAIGRPSGETEQTTTGAIAKLSGSGGISSSVFVNSGSSVTAQFGQTIIFNSASGTAKTVNAPPATGSLNIVEMADGYNDANVNAITFVPNGSDVVIGGSALSQVYTSYGSARFRDVAVGKWLNV